MDNQNGDRPLGPNVVSALLTYADQFERGVADRQEIFAATAAQAIAQCLMRFSPTTFSKVCAAQSKAVDRPSFLKHPSRRGAPSDADYLLAVRGAVREFKDALASGDIARATGALLPTGIFSEEEGLQSELQGLETKLFQVGGAMRLQYLPRAAKLAFWAGDLDKAKEYATEAVTLEPPNDPSNDGEGAHDGNMVLGLIALRDGDIEKAKLHLLASVQTNVSGALTMTGPNLSLANELLKINETETVISYLQECKRFWLVGRKALDTWIEKLRNGESLEFDPVHLSL